MNNHNIKCLCKDCIEQKKEFKSKYNPVLEIIGATFLGLLIGICIVHLFLT